MCKSSNDTLNCIKKSQQPNKLKMLGDPFKDLVSGTMRTKDVEIVALIQYVMNIIYNFIYTTRKRKMTPMSVLFYKFPTLLVCS